MPEPQDYCCLPWCGASYGAPYHSRTFRVDGRLKKYSYPSMIEMHDVVPRSAGGDHTDLDNNVPLCLMCHSAHHSRSDRRLTFDGTSVRRADGLSGELMLGDRSHLDDVPRRLYGLVD